MSSYTTLTTDDTRTAANVVSDARRMMLSGIREHSVFTSATPGASATQVVFDDIDDINTDVIRRGSLLELTETGELLYVKSVQEQALTATVSRQYDGTGSGTPAAADLADKELRLNPIYPVSDLFQNMKAEIASLHGEGIHRWIRVDFTITAGTDQVYDVDTESTEIVEVYDARANVGVAADPVWRPTTVELLDFADTADYSDGSAFRAMNHLPVGTEVEVICRARITEPTALSDTLADIGVNQEVYAVLTAGIAWRSMLGMEARRVQHAVSSSMRRAEDSPPNSSAFAARAFQGMRNDLLRAAQEAQYRRWPIIEARAPRSVGAFARRDRYWEGYS